MCRLSHGCMVDTDSATDCRDVLTVGPSGSDRVHFLLCQYDSSSLVCRGWNVQPAGDVVGGVGQTWDGGEVVPVEVDGVLEVAGSGQGSRHHG